MTPVSTIPLAALASQIVAISLANQAARVQVYQKRTGLYLDLYLNDEPVVTGVLCRDRVWLIRDAYRGFSGDLCFVDTQGLSDPDYTGLGSRFVLVWGL
ncbi:phage baseplate plug protein [Sphingobium sp. WCS2017Hpa-17]|uniref:phage baseplate plug family protein n=1 Tax=Sphingobium sp. WCS2017Hpa-17 TaxID=3073638 RepID=UPI00288B8BD7|nr:hypothetical protein [Sphingobium sp. WCS2017Hpa-17]